MHGIFSLYAFFRFLFNELSKSLDLVLLFLNVLVKHVLYTTSERGHCFNMHISRSVFFEQNSFFISLPPSPRADKGDIKRCAV